VTALASDNGALKELDVRENCIPPEEEALLLLQGVCSAKAASLRLSGARGARSRHIGCKLVGCR
jgi:hypothetical protein